jgi:radical SAM protein with 4Fe4S-binding SPASM domain
MHDAKGPPGAGRGMMRHGLDFKQAPLLLIWEITRACALACRHCRASAEDWRDPRELTTDEGKNVLDQVAAMGTPLVVFTGGDPLQRDDLEELIRHGRSAGLKVGAIPAATPRLTRERVVSLKEAGLHQMALSLDGVTAEKHDTFRRVEGTYAKVMEGCRWAREVELPLQINSVFGAWNVDDFDATADLVESLGIVFWEVFFLVPTGRGSELQGCTPDQFEQLFAKLYERAKRVKYIIKITEAPHYRRYVAQQAGAAENMRLGMSPQPVNAGRGFCFVDRIGDICPSGFLPLVCGNVRKDAIAEVYRNHPVFRELRDENLLKGRCGRCPYKGLCSGGSRARAYALNGDYLAEDPYCAYQPPAAGA